MLINSLVATVGFIIGFFLFAYTTPEPEKCPEPEKQEKCSKIDDAFVKAIGNCVDREDWPDYDCVRYIYTGRSPVVTPSPSPLPTPTFDFKSWQKRYYDNDKGDDSY